MADNEKVASKPSLEWHPSKRWNPFNSYKLLAHVHRWSHIKRGRPIPAPILITVDPTNRCNFDCEWCNAEFVRKKPRDSISKKTLLALADFLPSWGPNVPDVEPGVKAVCVAGGGEPLLNPATSSFIDRLSRKDIEIGLVTNGSLIHKNVDALSQCTWVGVSVDAGTAKTFDAYKGTRPEQNIFDTVITNIELLADYARRHNTRLGMPHPAYGVSFKYLLYKDNIGEIVQATKLAKEIGCKNIHFRPASTTWDKIGGEQEISFSPEQIELFREQIAEAVEYSDENFGVFGVTHKFNSQFTRANYFDRCYAVFMTAVVMAPMDPSAPEDAFNLGLCCDRRGDPKLELLRQCTDPAKINQVWGNEAHWNVLDSVNVCAECPRCTYQPHNEIYEQVILNDSMTYKFI